MTDNTVGTSTTEPYVPCEMVGYYKVIAVNMGNEKSMVRFMSGTEARTHYDWLCQHIGTAYKFVSIITPYDKLLNSAGLDE